MKYCTNLAFAVSSMAVLALQGADLARGGLITLPSDLPSGAKYQLIFVTAGTRDATSADIDEYNAFVTAEAALSPDLPGDVTWRAIGSTSTTDARDNAPAYDDIPIYNTQGQLVADGIADGVLSLWDGTIENAVCYDQCGVTVSDTIVWTGSSANGTARYLYGTSAGPLGSPAPEDPSDSHVVFGSSTSVNYKWMNRGALADFYETHSLYALSSPITVAPMIEVPEPGTLVVLLCVGAVGLACCWRLSR